MLSSHRAYVSPKKSTYYLYFMKSSENPNKKGIGKKIRLWKSQSIWGNYLELPHSCEKLWPCLEQGTDSFVNIAD